MKRVSILIAFVLALVVADVSSAQNQTPQGTFNNPAMEPNDEARKAITRGRVQVRRGDLEAGVAEFTKAAKLRNDECAECYQLIGMARFQGGDFKAAAAAFKRALTMKPANEGELHNWVGVSLYLQNDKTKLAEAADALRKALELSKGTLVRARYNLGFTLIKLGDEEKGKEELKAYLKALPDSGEAFSARAVLANPKLVNERFAIGFKVNSMDGQELSLEKLSGKVVLLDFWATWCGPCRVEMPEVKRLWKRYSNENFVLVGISLDDDREVLDAYLKKEGITWPQYFEADRISVSDLYGVRGIPHTVLIDQNGVIRAVGHSAGRLSGKIGELLKKGQQETAATGK